MTGRRTVRPALAGLVALGLAALGLAGPAGAQIGAVRRTGPRPAVILMLDSSGSMGHDALTGAAPECVPGGTCEESRYLVVERALVGADEGAQCLFEELEPDVPPPEGFPLVCGANLADGGGGGGSAGDESGILDAYRDTVRFGLLVSDNIDGAKVDANGGYSYGPAATVVLDGETVSINLGARNDGSRTGPLLGIGRGNDSSDLAPHNALVQETVASVVPFAESSIDAFLQDAVIYLASEPSLERGGRARRPRENDCRNVRFVLITDGVRHSLYDGDAPAKPEDWDGAAAVGSLTGTYTDVTVIPMTADAQVGLQALAEAGADVTDPADTVDELRAALDRVIAGVLTGGERYTESQTGSRSTVLTHSERIGNDFIGQMQVGAAYTVVSDGADEVVRSGHLERIDYLCGEDEPERVVDLAVDPELGLPNQTQRTVWTSLAGEVVALSSAEVTRQNLQVSESEVDDLIGWFHWQGSAQFPFDEAADPRLGPVVRSTPAILGPPVLDLPFRAYQGPTENGLHYKEVHKDRPTVALFGANDALVHAFVLAQAATDPRNDDLRPELWAYLPSFLLHRAQDVARGAAGQSFVDGPPVVRTVRLRKAADQTPDQEISGGLWRDVMVGGAGAGGPFWYALDVTGVQSAADGDSKPDVLWEFPGLAHPNLDPGALDDLVGADGELVEATRWLGEAWARPAVGSVTLEEVGRRVDRAVAFVPGGRAAGSDTRGRSFYVVRLEKDPGLGGLPRVLRSFRTDLGNQEDDLSFPIVGDPVAFHEGPGLQTSRVFVGDQAGRLWRIDVSADDPRAWTMKLAHDAYEGERLDSNRRRPVVLAPALSEDQSRRLVVVYATGDPTDLQGLTSNQKVFSLTELLEVDVDSGTRVFDAMRVNWRIDLEVGEVSTGAPVVFDETAYFPTFSKRNLSVCARGEGRIWAVDFVGLAARPEDDPSDNVIPRYATPVTQRKTAKFLMADPPLCSTEQVVTNPNDLARASLYCALGSAVTYGLDITFRPLCADQFNDPAYYGGGDGGMGRRPTLSAQATGTSTGRPAGVNRQQGNAQSLSPQLRTKLQAPQNLPMPLSWGVVFE